MSKVKDMLDTIKRLLCRAMSWDLDISRFTANIIIIIVMKTFGTKQGVLHVAIISF